MRASWDDVLLAEKMGREELLVAEERHVKAMAAAAEQRHEAVLRAEATGRENLEAAAERWARTVDDQEMDKAGLADALERANEALAKAEKRVDELKVSLAGAEANTATMRRLVVGALLESGLTMDDLMHPATLPAATKEHTP